MYPARAVRSERIVLVRAQTRSSEENVAVSEKSQANAYESIYGSFANEVLARIRAEAFGEDIGQNSWTTVPEFRRFLGLLALAPGKHLLDVCCGSGGPALFASRETGCLVTGIDHSEGGIAQASRLASTANLPANFLLADAERPLTFDDQSFDAIISIDAINHLEKRLDLFREFRRTLKPGGRLLFTDALIVTGAITSSEIVLRSHIGPMSFTPPGEYERLLRLAGLEVLEVQDVTSGTISTAKRRRNARQKYSHELIAIEGRETFNGLQAFLETAYQLAADGKLSRFVFFAARPDSPSS